MASRAQIHLWIQSGDGRKRIPAFYRSWASLVALQAERSVKAKTSIHRINSGFSLYLHNLHNDKNYAAPAWLL
jgi:hypothetical protein